MAGQETVEVIIDENGNPQIKVIGCSGPACKALTADLERDLGKTVNDTPTHEMTQRAQVKQK